MTFGPHVMNYVWDDKDDGAALDLATELLRIRDYFAKTHVNWRVIDETIVHLDATGWIVCSGDGSQFRVWRDGMPTWTKDVREATRYARRKDAEDVHREDEDAWKVMPVCEISSENPT